MADVTTAPDEVLVGVFAAEWALAESGVALTAGGVEVDDDVTQAFGDASRAGARIWLDAHPDHFMAEQVRVWLDGPDETSVGG